MLEDALLDSPGQRALLVDHDRIIQSIYGIMDSQCNSLDSIRLTWLLIYEGAGKVHYSQHLNTRP